MNLGDYGASVIRTIVAYVYALAITALLEVWTSAPSEFADWVGSEMTIGAITTVAAAAWYAVWRWFEPRLPDWLTRLTIGSAKHPSYTTAA